MTSRWIRVAPLLSLTAVAALAVACGEERTATSSLPPDSEISAGQRVSLSSGCSACHGPNGEGGMGPKWTGLFGSQVTLADGSTVTADEAYLTLAIKDPSAQKVKGYSVMPPNRLTDADVQALVDYIKSL
ncbi:MAG: cytochrome c [Actinomycetota bacterium]|nr:cytochrome c [Actinomycetota bacterium]